MPPPELGGEPLAAECLWEGFMKKWVSFTFAAALTTTLVSSALAAVPGSGTLSPSNPVVTYTGGPYTGANPSNQTGDPDCSLVPNTCDDFELTVDVPPFYLVSNPGAIIQIRLTWPGPGDFD